MKDDEFGNGRRISERGNEPREFGRIQRNEYSSSSKSREFGSVEVHNQAPTVNHEIKSGALGDAPESDAKQTINNAEKATKIANIAHVVTTSATVVAAATVTVVTGVRIIGSSNASVTFNNLYAFDNGLEYSLILRDSDEKDPFSIKVENPSYRKTYLLQEGENFGYFEGLTLGNEYTITVAQERLGGNLIYSNSFKFAPSVGVFESSVYGFDFESNSFQVAMWYEDNEERLSDFSIVLEKGSWRKSYPLSKTIDSQTVSFEEGDIQKGETYSYWIEYRDYASIRKSRVFQVVAEEEMRAHLLGCDFSDYDFRAKTVMVTARYEDPDSIITSLSVDIAIEGVSKTYPLSLTSEPQQISLEGFDDLVPMDCIIAYTLNATTLDAYDDITFSNVVTIDDETYLPASYTGIEFLETFDYSERTIAYKLQYNDPDDILPNPSITISYPTSYEYTAELTKSADYSYLSLSDFRGINPSNWAFDYKLTYLDPETSKEVSVQGSHVASDSSYVASTFRGLTLGPDFNSSDYSTTVLLDYQDDFHEFENPVLYINDGTQEIEISLGLTSDIQPISLSGLRLDPLGSEVTYRLTYTSITSDEQLSIEGSTTLADPSLATPHFDAVEFGKYYDPEDGSIELSLDYYDPKDVFGDLTLVLTQDGETVFDGSISKTSETQRIVTTAIFQADGTTLSYVLSYSESGSADKQTIEGEFSVTRNPASYFNGLESPLAIVSDVTSSARYLPYRVNGDYDSYSGSTLQVLDNEEIVFSGQLDAALNEWGMLDISASSLVAGKEYTFVLVASSSGASSDDSFEIYREPITLTDESNSVVYGLTLDQNPLDTDNLVFRLSLISSRPQGFNKLGLSIAFEDETFILPFDPSLAGPSQEIEIIAEDALNSGDAGELASNLGTNVNIDALKTHILDQDSCNVGIFYEDQESNNDVVITYQGLVFAIA